MYTIVVDADGLIKLGKSGALPALLGAARLLVPKAVWEEAVEEGKRRMYEDAHELEAALLQGAAEVVSHEVGEKVERLLAGSAASFGAGERAALAVYFAAEADAVLTDDRAFLGLLAGADPPVPALVPAAAIVALAEGGLVTIDEAREALAEIEPAIRRGAYEAAMEDLEMMERARDGEQ
ncbi:MAG TPA: hypothetical protein VFY59_02130 [Rubrobacter sp.]|nr:hypothetical protein [Rubrobacter sp.]